MTLGRWLDRPNAYPRTSIRKGANHFLGDGPSEKVPTTFSMHGQHLSWLMRCSSVSPMPLAPLEGQPDPDGADCVACGRCCHHGPHTVMLHESDEERLSPDVLHRLTVVLDRPPFFRFVKNDGEHCGALDVTVTDQFPCMIYAARPEGCREVEPGSPCCLEARRLGHLGKSVEFKRVREE